MDVSVSMSVSMSVSEDIIEIKRRGRPKKVITVLTQEKKNRGDAQQSIYLKKGTKI
jgi:hypothetical protein